MNTAHRTRCRSFPVYCCSVFLLTSIATAQTERVDLAVDDPRPVAKAVLRLAEQYATIVTYEDPRYKYSGDLRDVTQEIGRDPASSSRTLIPEGAVIHATYEISASTGLPIEFAGMLSSILESAHIGPPGGRFDLRQDGDMFHIVPAQIRDAQGHWTKQTPILDQRITLSTEELNGYELTEAILQEVGEAAEGVRVGLAVERFAGSFLRHRGRIDAHDEPARDVLLSTLHDISERFTYLLLYDPSGEYYVLNVALVAETQPDTQLDLSEILPTSDAPAPAGPTESSGGP